jgi:hypothetical protein
MSNKKNLCKKAILGVVGGLAATSAPLAAQGYTGSSHSCSGQAAPANYDYYSNASTSHSCSGQQPVQSYTNVSYSQGYQQPIASCSHNAQPYPSYTYTYAADHAGPAFSDDGQVAQAQYGTPMYQNPYHGNPQYSQYQSMEQNRLSQEKATNQWPRLNNPNNDGLPPVGQYNTNTPTWLPQNQNNVANQPNNN